MISVLSRLLPGFADFGDGHGVRDNDDDDDGGDDDNDDDAVAAAVVLTGTPAVDVDGAAAVVLTG